MKNLLLTIVIALVIASCGDDKQDIASRQLEIQNKVDSIDRVHDSLSAVMENTSDMRTDELVKIQLMIKKLDEDRAHLLTTYDSLQREMNEN